MPTRRFTSSKQHSRAFRTAARPADEGAASGNGDPGRQRKPHDPSKRRQYLGDYRQWLWPYRWALGGLILLSFITAGLGLGLPLAIKRIMDVLPGPLAAAVEARALAIFWLVIITVLVAQQALGTLR